MRWAPWPTCALPSEFWATPGPDAARHIAPAKNQPKALFVIAPSVLPLKIHKTLDARAIHDV
jgi:hypothetical protein